MFEVSRGLILIDCMCAPLLACLVWPPTLFQSLLEPNGPTTCLLRELFQTSLMGNCELLQLNHVCFFSLPTKILVF